MTAVYMYEVGGCVRDALLGRRTKDIDFAVELPAYVGAPAAAGFAALREHLTGAGYEIFVESPEFLTIRAHFPKDHPEHGRTTADFVLARRDGAYTDGRRPDEVFVGTLTDDLARRDFTINAMARSLSGEIVDPHGGQDDLGRRVLRCVGDTFERMGEDALRALRAVRFAVTLGFTFDDALRGYLGSAQCRRSLASVSTERRREELLKAFSHDTTLTLRFMHNLHPRLLEAACEGGMWLRPTMERP